MYDPSKVERTRWVSHDYEGYSPWPEDGTNDEIVGDDPDAIRITVEAAEFDACAEALAEARTDLAARQAVFDETMSLVEFLKRQTETLAKQRDEALRIVKRYREGEGHKKYPDRGKDLCMNDGYGDTRCPICKAVDEALGGK